MEGVSEYCEDMNVSYCVHEGRDCIEALNEAGCNSTLVDVEELLRWLAINKPQIIAKSVADVYY